MNSRNDLEAALRRSAETPTPPADPSFVDALERRLLADRRTVVAFAPTPKRLRRVSVATVAAVAIGLGGAAATAAVIVTHVTKSPAPPAEEPATTEGPEPTTTLGPDTTVVLQTGTSTPAPAPTDGTGPGSGTSAPATTAAPYPTPATTPATTTAAPPPSPPPATTTTEVHTPATITLSCQANGTAINCSWTAFPGPFDHYAVLRGQPNSTGPGRVFFVAAGTTNWTDPSAVPGTKYSYVVHAFDASNQSQGHSGLIVVDCC